MLLRVRFRHPRGQERRQLRPLLHPHGGDAPVDQDHEAVLAEALRGRRAGAGRGRRPQDRAAQTRRDEALHGGAHPPLQALHRRLSRSRRRGLRRGRSAQGRVRRLSHRRRRQQALQVQNPGARLCPPPGHGFPLPGLHARRHNRDTRLARSRVRGGRSLMSVRRLADAAIQPKSFAFTVENLDWAKGEIAKYPEGRQASAILALLWRAQEQAGGWLPQKAIEHVADLLGMAKIRALEVATFYTMFNLAPVGQFHVQLCGTTPCVLRGADKLIKLCHDTIGAPLQISGDGKLSWVEVECLGACVNAPVAQINYDYYEDLTPESFTKILDDLAADKAVKPGPQVARQFSAPSGGPTTLTDPTLYAHGNGGPPHDPALRDADAKWPGEPANVREAAAPKSPVGDSSANRRS